MPELHLMPNAALGTLRRVGLCVVLLVAFAVVSCRGTHPSRNTDSDLIAFSKIDRAWALTKGGGATVAVIDWQFDLGWRAARKYVMPVSVVPGEEVGAMKPWHGEWMAEIVHRVAPEARIIPINARTLKQRGYDEYLVKGIRYAAEHGAVAATSSMGPTRQSPELLAAIDAAEARGLLFVDVHPEMIADAGGKLRPCADITCDPRIVRAGIVSVPQHLVAPDPSRDVYVWPYDLDMNFRDGWGFSNGPPVIAGVIALVKSVDPTLSPAAVKSLLIETANLRDGFRVLDAEAAVKRAFSDPTRRR